MKKTIFATVLLMALGASSINAQKKNLVLHYDFNKQSINTVEDRSRSHADAWLINGAYTEGGNLVLKSKDAYLDMTQKAGEVMQSLTDFTICTRYKIDSSVRVRGNGYFLYCFSNLAANKEKDGPYHAYRINQQRVETSIGGWSQETGIQQGKASVQSEWVTVVFRQKAGHGELYINGTLIGTEEGFPQPNINFATAPEYCWMGRAPFDGDNYLSNTLIDDFRIYNKCISDRELKKLLK